MTDLIFNFQDQRVRTVIIDGEPWFVLADVVSALQLARSAAQVKERLDDGVRKTYPLETAGGIQRAIIVSEPGLYEVIIRSNSPHAKPFKDWVLKEVLPSIRKTGSYGTPQLSGPALMAAALIEAQRTLDDQAKQIEAQKPKVLFADAVATSRTSILIGDLAKILKANGLDIGANRLFERLREDGFLIRRKGSDWNMPTQKAMDLGLFEIKETAINHSDGHVTLNKTPKVTGKGQIYFANRFLEAVA